MEIIGVVEGKYFDDLQVGDAFGSSVTLTETHLVLGSALFGDFNPVHVNETFVQKGPFQKRIFPGPFTLGVMASSLGNFFAGTAVANTNISGKFLKPVFANDTVTTRWTIEALTYKEKLKAGFVELAGRCVNQHGHEVVESRAVVLVHSKPNVI
ncbi:MaoC family dehydratase [Paenibacillus naphthalenovorans]|uniref:HotDog domain-containing protein n=1 Tax=Paenibacillus naphthalenovorans TaxID=162209 RepID=A0A0U2WD82_9BACL|nr:MaoC family dehydratase [Paenibacillus naphthalenovorans]ALS25445.1 HotDog domain-containing protein [Paenibacillus naphthalenovorans]